MLLAVRMNIASLPGVGVILLHVCCDFFRPQALCKLLPAVTLYCCSVARTANTGASLFTVASGVWNHTVAATSICTMGVSSHPSLLHGLLALALDQGSSAPKQYGQTTPLITSSLCTNIVSKLERENNLYLHKQ